jgi:hypothetical protein
MTGDLRGNVMLNRDNGHPRACGSASPVDGSANRRDKGPQHLNRHDDCRESTGRPSIEPEPIDRIVVGAGGKLVVPRENILAGFDPDEELDLVELEKRKTRKPGRREWIAIQHDAELPTRLLINEPKPGSIDPEYFFVASQLRAPIYDELKSVRVFPYYSFWTGSHAIWIVKVTPDNPWYESLQSLLSLSHEFFDQHAVRVFSAKNKYRVKYKALPTPVTWPSQSTSELLGEALGNDHFITSATHPVYRDLVDGEELE